MIRRLLGIHKDEGKKQNYFHLIDHPCAQSEIRRNIERDISHWQKVSIDIVSVEVGKTLDTNDYVLAFTDSKGRVASLWLNGNKLRSITPY